jgi:hypothetical protein
VVAVVGRTTQMIKAELVVVPADFLLGLLFL